MYRVIGNGASRTIRVTWMLEELGVPYAHGLAHPRSPEARQHNPSGKVPILLVDGAAITDSAAILTYLADAHGQFTSPAGSIRRAQQDGMLFRILDELDAVLWTGSRHKFVLPAELRMPAITDSLKWEFARTCGFFDQLLADRPFACGEEMTVPDFILTHCLRWATNSDFPVEGDALTAYRDRMSDRPAFVKARELIWV